MSGVLWMRLATPTLNVKVAHYDAVYTLGMSFFNHALSMLACFVFVFFLFLGGGSVWGIASA